MKVSERIFLLIISLILCMPSVFTADAADNICAFSGFEEEMDGWDNDFECTMYRTDKEAHSGNFSMETTVINDWGCPKFYYNFIPGVKYKISVWVKVKGAPSTAEVIMDYSPYGPNQPYWQWYCSGTRVSSDKWTELTFDYTYGGGNPLGKANIFVRIGNGKVDFSSEERTTYYLDDFTISYKNTDYSYKSTVVSEDETAVNMGFDMNTDGYVCENAEMKYVKNGCNGTYGAALVKIKSGYGYVGQDYSVEEGKKYILSAYIKSPYKNIPFRFVIREGSGGIYKTKALGKDVIVGNEWTKITAEYEYTNGDSGKNKRFLITGGSGNNGIVYYLDEFSIISKNTESEILDLSENIYSNPTGGLALYSEAGYLTDNVKPYFNNGEFMCSADSVARAIGAKSGFLPNGEFYFLKGVNRLILKPYSTDAYYNDTVKIQKNKPIFINENLVCSADFVTKAFGVKTEFSEKYRTYAVKSSTNGYLLNTINKINSGETLKIAYFGGSFMRGGDTDYPVVESLESRITNRITEMFPNLKTEITDASVNGTDCVLGAYRLEDDVLKYEPDLIFIDFSVNDFRLKNPYEVAKYTENIIRRIYEAKKETDIVLVNTASAEMGELMERGTEPKINAVYRNLGAYYDIPVLNIGQQLFDDCISSGKKFSENFIKNMQLTESAASYYMTKIDEFLTDSFENCNNLYEKVISPNMFGTEKICSLIMPENVSVGDGWQFQNKKIAGSKGESSLFSDTEGSMISVGFTGSTIGIYWQVSPKSGAVEYRIDGGKWIYLDCFDEYAYKYSRPSYVILDENLKSGKHTLEIRVSDKANKASMGKEIVIGGFLTSE